MSRKIIVRLFRLRSGGQTVIRAYEEHQVRSAQKAKALIDASEYGGSAASRHGEVYYRDKLSEESPLMKSAPCDEHERNTTKGEKRDELQFRQVERVRGAGA